MAQISMNGTAKMLPKNQPRSDKALPPLDPGQRRMLTRDVGCIEAQIKRLPLAFDIVRLMADTQPDLAVRAHLWDAIQSVYQDMHKSKLVPDEVCKAASRQATEVLHQLLSARVSAPQFPSAPSTPVLPSTPLPPSREKVSRRERLNGAS